MLLRLLLLVKLNSCTDLISSSFHLISQVDVYFQLVEVKNSLKRFLGVGVCVWFEGGDHPSSCYTISPVLTAAVDCCHRNRQPITRSERQGVGLRPPRATGRTIPPTPPISLPCVFFDCLWVVVCPVGFVRSEEGCVFLSSNPSDILKELIFPQFKCHV